MTPGMPRGGRPWAAPDAGAGRATGPLTDHWYWRTGWGVGTRYLIWYLTWEEHADVHDHVAPFSDALRQVPSLDVVPVEWLHTTVQGVGHVSGFPPERVTALADGAARALAGCRAPVVRLARPQPLREAVAVELEPDGCLDELVQAVRAATAEALGESAMQDAWPRPAFPHLSLAYAAGVVPREQVEAALAAVPEAVVETTVRAVSLVELHRDHRQYEWRRMARVPVGPDTTPLA